MYTKMQIMKARSKTLSSTRKVYQFGTIPNSAALIKQGVAPDSTHVGTLVMRLDIRH